MSRRKKNQPKRRTEDGLSGIYVDRKLTTSEERDLKAWFEQQHKPIDAALKVNPEIRSLYQKVGKREKTASCRELKRMLEQVRMLLDNKEWEDEPEWLAVNHLFHRLLRLYKKECGVMWKEFGDKLSRKYLEEMEEAWYWRNVEPKKEYSEKGSEKSASRKRGSEIT